MKYLTITDAYEGLIKDVTSNGTKIGNTLELLNYTITITQPSLENMQFKERKISTKYANAELKWYWSADNSCKTIGAYAKKWLAITDDGLTNNSAYGYILFKKYKKNQLEEVIELLQKDKNTRRAVLNISDPSIDRINTKDMQCTIALQFLIRNDKLQMYVYMRSNDVIFGFPYDYIFFESIHQYVAKRLNIQVGEYSHTATSMHIYLTDIDKLKTNNEYVTIDYESIIKENYEN